MKKAIKNIQMFVIIAAAVFYLQTQNVNAAWGDFDTSFGLQGAVVESLTGYYPLSVAIQPDGKILVAGTKDAPGTTDNTDFAVVRRNSNGSPDPTFNSTETVVTPVLGDGRGNAVAIQPDGRFDATVFRPSNNTWYSQRTTAGTLIQQFGVTGDQPIPTAFIP